VGAGRSRTGRAGADIGARSPDRGEHRLPDPLCRVRPRGLDRAPSCPQCGVPIFRESKVVVHGYTQQFLVNPKIKVFWNGADLGSVKKGAVLTHQVAVDGVISFSVRQA
jgi:hypothetical protein